MRRITNCITCCSIKIETLIFAGVINFSMLFPLQGRIGDDPKACALRYGVAIDDSPDGGFIEFEKDGIRVACRFSDGSCVAISYTLIRTGSVTSKELEEAPRFTDEQEARILNLNRGGSTWIQESRDSYGEKKDGVYKTSDGKLYALVNSSAVTVESIAFLQAKLAKINPAAIDKTLTAFEGDIENVQNPVISYLPDVPKQPDPLEESIKQLEKSTSEMQEDMERRNLAAADAKASIDLIAKRVEKRQQMREMLERLKVLEAELAAAQSPEVLKTLRAKEAALTAEMNQAVKDYEELDAEYKRSNSIDASPSK